MSRGLKDILAIVFLAAASLAAPRPAEAVCTYVSPYCSATYTNFNFGTVTVGTLTGAMATATVTTTCWPGYPVVSSTNNYCYSIGTGTNSTSETNRTLKSGSSAIQYQIYNEPSFATQCKLTDNRAYPVCQATGPFPATQTQVLTKTLYAKILSSAALLPPGTYTDSYTGDQANVNYRGDTTVECGGHCNFTPFTLTLTIASSCTVSASNMVFPSTGFITSNVDSTATLTVTCTNTTPHSVTLSAGAGAGATMFNRIMTGPDGKTVNYNLFSQPPPQWLGPLGRRGFFGGWWGFGHGNRLAAVAHGLRPRARSDGAPAGALPGHGVVTLTY